MFELGLRNVSVYEGLSDDSTAFTASLYVNGQRVAVVKNDGNGGAHLVQAVAPYERNREILSQVEAWAQEQPARTVPAEWEPDGVFRLECDLELVISELLGAEQHRRWMKRQCQNKTLFRLPGDEPGTYRTVNRPYDEAVNAWLVAKYHDRKIEIVNPATLAAPAKYTGGEAVQA